MTNGEKNGVVVLNYKKYQETIECVLSLLNQDYPLEIVIVDNCSENDSVDILRQKFSLFTNISLIESSENVGYARGNNLGIKYLTKKGINNIIICNSDVRFTSKNIVSEMLQYNNDNVGIITPIIRNLDGSIEMRAQYKVHFFGFRVMKELCKMIIPKNAGSSGNSDMGSYWVLQPGVQKEYMAITGSVYMLTDKYLSIYKGLFPKTFLYVEELATMLLCYKAHLRTAIAHTEDVLHKGAASTDRTMLSGSPAKTKMVRKSAIEVLKLAFEPSFFAKKKY